MSDEQWQTITWREGSRGAMRKQFVAVRMHWAIGTAARTLEDQRVYTGAEGWLIGERPLPGEEGECTYSFSNLPADRRLEQLVPFVRGRWPIEQFYKEAKQECGLDDYQGRRWDGLHRHLTLVMLAYSFLVHERMQTAQDPAGSSDSGHPKRSSLPAIQRAHLALAPPGLGTLVDCHRSCEDLPLPEGWPWMRLLTNKVVGVKELKNTLSYRGASQASRTR
jgi:SRSO17 transposase